MSVHRRRSWSALLGLLILLVALAWLLFPDGHNEISTASDQTGAALEGEAGDVMPQSASGGGTDLSRGDASNPSPREASPLLPGRVLVQSLTGTPVADALLLIRTGGIYVSGSDGMITLPASEQPLAGLIHAEGYGFQTSSVTGDGDVVVLHPVKALRLQAVSKRDGAPVPGLLVEVAFEDRWLAAPDWEEFAASIPNTISAVTDGEGRAYLEGVHAYRGPTALRVSRDGMILGHISDFGNFSAEIESLGFFRVRVSPDAEPWRIQFRDQQEVPLAHQAVTLHRDGMSQSMMTDADGSLQLGRGLEGATAEIAPFYEARVARPGRLEWSCRWEDAEEVEGGRICQVGDVRPRIHTKPWLDGYEFTIIPTGLEVSSRSRLRQVAWQRLETEQEGVQIGVAGGNTHVAVRHRASGVVVDGAPLGADGSATVSCVETGALTLRAPAAPAGHRIGWRLNTRSFNDLGHSEQWVQAYGADLRLDLPVGTYDVACQYDGFVFASRTVQLTPSGAEVLLTDAPQIVHGWIRGSLTGPRAGRAFNLVHEDLAETYVNARTGPDGTFTACLLHPGIYHGRLYWPLVAEGQTERRRAWNDTNVPIEWRLEEGKVVEALIEEGALEFDLDLPPDRRVIMKGRSLLTQQSHDHFTIEVQAGDRLILPVGDYEITFHPYSEASVSQIVSIRSGATTRVALDLPSVHRLDSVIRSSPGWHCSLQLRFSSLAKPDEVIRKIDHEAVSAIRLADSWLPEDRYTLSVTGYAQPRGAADRILIDESMEFFLDRDRVLLVTWSDSGSQPGIVCEIQP